MQTRTDIEIVQDLKKLTFTPGDNILRTRQAVEREVGQVISELKKIKEEIDSANNTNLVAEYNNHLQSLMKYARISGALQASKDLYKHQIITPKNPIEVNSFENQSDAVAGLQQVQNTIKTSENNAPQFMKTSAEFPHPILDDLKKIKLASSNNISTIKTDVQIKVEQAAKLAARISDLPDNSELVAAYNEKMMRLYQKMRFQEQVLHQRQGSLGAAQFIKLIIKNVNGPLPVTENVAIPESISPVAVPLKKYVLTPHGMDILYRKLVNGMDIDKNGQLKKLFRAASDVLADARKVRKQSGLLLTNPTTSDIVEQLRDGFQERLSLNVEIQNAQKIKKLLNELRLNKPDLVNYNRLVEGFNHHLKRMLNDAERLVEPDMTAMIQALTMQPRITAEDASVAMPHDQSLLHDAIQRKDTDSALQIISSGTVDINIQDADGNTALHLAVVNGNISIVRALLDVDGININITNKDDFKPVSVANDILNNRPMHLRPQGKVGAHDKSASSHELIKEMLVKRALAQGRKQSTHHESTVERQPINLIEKYTKLFSAVNKNTSAIKSPIQAARCAINGNYSESHKRNIESLDKPSLIKVFNPLYAVNIVLAFMNIGVRALIDNLDSKIAGTMQNSSLAATIAKAILTAPISLAQVIVGGAADAISYVAQTAFKKSPTKHSEDIPLLQSSDSSRPSTALIDSTLVATPLADRSRYSNVAPVSKTAEKLTPVAFGFRKAPDNKNKKTVEPATVVQDEEARHKKP